MARKRATRRSEPGRRPGDTPAAVAAPRATTVLERLLLIAVVAAAALSVTILRVHTRLTEAHGAYTSFCNVNTRVNCDVVLMSPYGKLLGVPVAMWALLTYAVLAALMLIRWRTVLEQRARVTLVLVALAVWSLVFSLYMAAVAAFAIGAVCLLCSGLYALNALIAVLAWRIARSDTPRDRTLLTRRRLALGSAAMVGALAAMGGWQLASSSANSHLTAADVEAQNPKFYQWYTTRPVVSAFPAPRHVRGPDDAAITIIEFSDFECAYCGKAFRDVRDLERQHGDVRVIFHHFPLDPDCNSQVPSRVHKSACQAAVAAECAARSGRFWEYHDWLFTHQEQLGRDDLIAAAADLGIDREAFIACLADPAPRARVLADAEEGGRLGVKSTPTLFINGRTVEGALDRPAYDWVLAMERRG